MRFCFLVSAPQRCLLLTSRPKELCSRVGSKWFINSVSQSFIMRSQVSESLFSFHTSRNGRLSLGFRCDSESSSKSEPFRAKLSKHPCHKPRKARNSFMLVGSDFFLKAWTFVGSGFVVLHPTMCPHHFVSYTRKTHFGVRRVMPA